MIYGNPDLKPETSHNFSLSAEYMKGRYNLTVTGFYNVVDNRITTAWSEALKGQVYTNISISGYPVPRQMLPSNILVDCRHVYLTPIHTRI